MKPTTIGTALAGALLAAMNACAPMQQNNWDAGDSNVQAEGGSTETSVDAGTDANSSDSPGSDARDVIGKDTADVPTTDVIGMDATDIITTPDVPPVDSGPPVCPTTTALTLGTTVNGTLSGMSVFDSTMCQPNANGPEQVYTLHVDTMTGVTFSTGGSLDTIISIRTACIDASSEVACDDDGGAGTLSLLRTTLAPGDYFVVVDQYGSGTGGDYSLTTSTFTPAANATCATATTFSDTMPAAGDSTGGSLDSVNCAFSADGAVVYYSINVPAHTRATVTATPGGTPAWSPVLRVESDCSATNCLANATAPSDGMPANVNVDNRTDTPATFIVSVGSSSATTGGPFMLTATMGSIPTTPNAMCANATPVMNGTMLASENSDLGNDTLEAACVDYANGRVLYYRASIPASSILTVTATPTGTWNPVIRLLDSCGATTCLASADIGGDGEAESIRYTNSGTTPVSVLIAVGSSTSDTSGVFALATTIASLPYVETTGTTSCDDMSAATAVAGVDADDSASTIAPLPFMFPYMGANAAYFSVTSNGYVQLWTDTTGTPSTAYGNVPIPDSGDPNGFVAPLWDDLRPNSASTVLAQDFTAGERHFTVQWTAWGFYRDDTDTARITMQLKLFSGSGRIEFHYCSITPSSDGAVMNSESATIGVENLAGDNGFQHSVDTAGIDTTHAIVLTPAP